MNAAIQVIIGKKLFVIIETLFGVATSGYVEQIEDMSRVLKCNALYNQSNVINMPAIHVSDREVKRLADSLKLN